jgi:hypothetical protein
MSYLDDAIKNIILLAFILIVIIFVMSIILDIIANFFLKIFKIGKWKKNEKFDKN